MAPWRCHAGRLGGGVRVDCCRGPAERCDRGAGRLEGRRLHPVHRRTARRRHCPAHPAPQGCDPGRLGAERLLGLATAGLPPARQEWGTAMRAELLSIDDPSARRAFARSAAFAALRIGHARPLAIAGTTGLLAAAGTLAVSRLLLAVDKPIGIGIYTMFAPVLLLFAAALLGAATRRSFRSGLEAGVVALFVALVGVFAVMAVEAVTWAEHYGVYVFDGDRPSTGHLGPGGAVGDALSPFFIGLHLVLWVPWPVLGAALGAAVRRRPPADGAAARQGSSRS